MSISEPDLQNKNLCSFYLWSTPLATRDRLQPANTCKTLSDSMEKCWFSLDNCIRLSFCSLELGCWPWRLETCWQKPLIRLFPPSVPSTRCMRSRKVMRHLHAFGEHNSNYKRLLLRSLCTVVARGYSEGKYCARAKARATPMGHD